MDEMTSRRATLGGGRQYHADNVQGQACAIRFLLIADNPLDRELIVRELQQAFPLAEYVEVSQPLEFDTALAHADFHIVLTDYRLGWTDGLTVLQAVQERFPHVPVIMITGAGSEAIAVEGMKAGLSDYVLKGHVQRLPIAVQESLVKASLEAERAAEERFLQAQNDIARVALSSLQPEILMPRLLEAICRAQGYTTGLLYRTVDNGCAAVVMATYGEGAAAVMGYRQELSASDSCVAQAMRTGQPAFCNQLQASPLSAHPVTCALMAQALLALPLVGRTGAVVGALAFGDAQHPERFTELDLSQGTVLAHQIAQALEHSALFSQVQRLQEQYRVVTETLNDGVYVVNQEGQIVFANPALARLTGYDLEELLDHPSLMLYTPDIALEILRRRQESLKGQPVPAYLQMRMIRKDGQQVAVETSTAPFYVERRMVGRVVVARDITERLRLEAQFRQTQKLEAIGTLTGGIAHDFNNILTAVLGYTELTLDDVPEDSVAWHNLRNVLTAGERAKELVQHMLTFSRQIDQERQPVQLHLLVQEALTLVRTALPATMTLRHALDVKAGAVLANPAQIHQVILNLCANAEHAMRETGGTLSVRLETHALPTAVAAAYPGLASGPYVRLTVQDTGHGMTPEVTEHLFEPFFTTKGVGEGTGLGLAVVHGIVTHHGGAITVESLPGQGTTFTIYLPHLDASTGTTEPTKTPVPEGHERILFIDDEAKLAVLWQAVLTRLGYEVVTYTDSVEALQAFRAAPECFDLVITDHSMPRMTGEVLSYELRRLRQDIPIILCTGFSHVMTPEKAQRLGVDDFCLKPLRLSDLGVMIRRVLARRAVRER